jgi:hypothetical protein
VTYQIPLVAVENDLFYRILQLCEPKVDKGHQVGWERLKGAFLANDTRESVENLHQQCQTLNSMVSIDATVLGATTYKEIKEARKELQEWNQAGTKVSSAIKDGLDQLSQSQENHECQQERRVILDWLTRRLRSSAE